MSRDDAAGARPDPETSTPEASVHDRRSLLHWTRLRSHAVATGLSTDPYVRSARLLGYTLRSQVRGFFHDPRHPVARALLAHLHALAVESGEHLDDATRDVERVWDETGESVLAGAWKALCRDATDAIEHARTVGATEAETSLDDPERIRVREEAFAAWLTDRDDDHSM